MSKSRSLRRSLRLLHTFPSAVVRQPPFAFLIGAPRKSCLSPNGVSSPRRSCVLYPAGCRLLGIAIGHRADFSWNMLTVDVHPEGLVCHHHADLGSGRGINCSWHGAGCVFRSRICAFSCVTLRCARSRSSVRTADGRNLGIGNSLDSALVCTLVSHVRKTYSYP